MITQEIKNGTHSLRAIVLLFHDFPGKAQKTSTLEGKLTIVTFHNQAIFMALQPQLHPVTAGNFKGCIISRRGMRHVMLTTTVSRVIGPLGHHLGIY